MSREGNNVRAGVFVLAGMVLLVAVVILLSDFGRWFEPTQAVRVFYRLDDGLGGLKVGSAVTVGDKEVGGVTAIEDQFDPAADGVKRVVGQVVTVTIPQRYTLHRNAVVELVVPAVGGGTKLNIADLGSGPFYAAADEPIPGGLAGSSLTASLVSDIGLREREKQNIRDIIANVAAITGTLREDLPALAASARRILADAEPLAKDAGAAVADLKQTMADAHRIVAGLGQHSDVWFERIDRVTAGAEETVTALRTLTKDKDADLRLAVEHLRDSLAQTKDAAAQAKALLVSQGPVIEKTLAHLQITGAQLKLAAIEIRRSPWRLLYSPKDQELEHDNLYDAARSFALGAGAVEAATESLKALVESEGPQSERAARLLQYLESITAKFDEAQTRFWTALEEPSQ
jgi:ABC-type transporter Mla subunit MlaD